MEADVAAMSERHEGNFAMFAAAGGFAPTMGIIGTVMGLVNVLSHLDKPDELGKSIATAFIATLYGVLSANVFWLPVGERLKQRNKEEVGRAHAGRRRRPGRAGGRQPARRAREARGVPAHWRGAVAKTARGEGAAQRPPVGAGRPMTAHEQAAAQEGHAAEHENAERWLLTYADLITLLMVFFVVLYSMSSADSTKFKRVSASLQQAFNLDVLQGQAAVVDRRRQPSPAQSSRHLISDVRRTPGHATREQGPGRRSKARRRCPT